VEETTGTMDTELDDVATIVVNKVLKIGINDINDRIGNIGII
jgi:hypothetical protein